ncbi:MAG: PEP-CTERM sorting domain-containing protein [Okeania sp. SIO2C9]|uniref:PEP-CTERM sorting domain-containing protein n=1 Tax=Okeania sp. SIO2C9 TaxID=2607791 RepID=UPI0013BFC84B|nr:PEP-CTERM sorting domain-containing protein [Okeania sp. SIO2C9]NEQ75641.1 PEP-CTERM sorting domain-containing protein [Okeania sp. SIO2C9]
MNKIHFFQKLAITSLITTGITAAIGITNSVALAGARLSSFPSEPMPNDLDIPESGMFTGSQTFTIMSFWDNDWDTPVDVTLNFNLVQTTGVNDIFPFVNNFTLGANVNNQKVSLFATLSADQLNDAIPLLGGPLEFELDSPTFSFVKTPDPCSCTPPEPEPQGSLPKNPILTALMKPISASASTILSMFEQPAHAQVTDVCPPCPIPEPSSILSLFALGSIGASSTLLHKKKKQKLKS